MKNKFSIENAVATLKLALLLGMLHGCGGGSDGTSNTPSIAADSSGYAIDDYVIGAKVRIFALGSNTAQLETTTGSNGQFTIPGSLANGSYRVEVSGGFEDLDGNSATTSDQHPFTDTLSALLELTTDRTPILVNAITTGLERYAAGDKTKYQDAMQALPGVIYSLQTGTDPSSLEKTLGQVLSLQRSVGFEQVVQELADDGRINASAGTLSSAGIQSVASAGRDVGVLAALIDANLRLCIADSLEKDVPDVTRNELLALSRLNCNNAGIQSLTGISTILPNLARLHLEDNLISNLAPLADLKKLTFLNVRSNRVTSLKTLAVSDGEQIAMMVAENCIETPSELNDSVRLMFTGYDTRAKRQFSSCLKNDAEVLAFTLRMKEGNDRLLVTRATYNPTAVCAIDWGDGNTQSIACDGRTYNLTHSYTAPAGLRAKFLVNGTVKREVAVSASVSGGSIPHTGITPSQCYAAGSDVLVSCTSAGAIALSGAGKQDGMYADVNTMSYSRVGSYPLTSCVKDNVTGLIWEGKEASGARAGSNTYTNHGDGRSGDASAYVLAINAQALCGYTDWRLPTVDELQGLVDYSKPGLGQMINTDVFVNGRIVNNIYWTSSPFMGNGSGVWAVDFYEGHVSYYYSRIYGGAVRLVRTSQ